jgi:hypothetical protein
MGHTLPPFSHQFKTERAMFNELKRALLQRDDKALFDDLWNKAEFYVPAAEKAKHPLPITSILMTMNLEQEKAIYQMEQKALVQNQRIQQLEAKLNGREAEKLLLKGEIETLRWEIEELKSSLRAELLDLLYPNYVNAA